MVRSVVAEITRTTSLVGGNIDYNEFVDWARGRADAVVSRSEEKLEKAGDLEYKWVDEPEGDTKVIAFRGGEAIGYVGLSKYLGGYKIITLGLKPAARGGGVAMKIYGYLIGKTKLYSDVHQTPEARRLWMRLSDLYDMKGYDPRTRKMFDVEKDEGKGELVSLDPDIELYSDEEGSDVCLVVLGSR